MDWKEGFLQTLVDNAKNAPLEEKIQARKLANKFVYSRLSYDKRDRWDEVERLRKQTLEESIKTGTRNKNRFLLDVFHQMEEARKENKEVVLVC